MTVAIARTPGPGVSVAAEPGQSEAGGTWPRTDRLLPWLAAGFLALIWLIPIDSVLAPVPLPFDGTPDRIALLVIGLFLFAAAAASTLRAGPRFRSGLPGQALILFLAVALVSLVANAATLAQLEELEVATKKVGVLIIFGLCFFILAAAIRPNEVMKLATFLVGLASLTALGVIYEYRTGTNVFFDWTATLLPSSIEVIPEAGDPKHGRELIQGPTEHAIAMATMFAMALPFALIGFMRSHVRKDRILYGIAVGLILGGAIATIRKTGAIAPATALLVVFLYKPKAMLRLLPLGLIIVIGIQAAAPGAIVRVKAQIVNGGLLSGRSSQARTEDYEPAKPDITRHPLIGRGHGSYNPDKYRFLDNEYLQRLIETGIVGTAAYVFLILAVALTGHRTARCRDPVKAGLGIAIVAAAMVYLVTNAVYDQLSFPQAPYMLLFIGAFAVVLRVPTTSEGEPPARRRTPQATNGHGAAAAVALPARTAPAEATNGHASVATIPHGNGLATDESGSATRGNGSATEWPTLPVDISVIVVTHNRRDLALATLRSARANTGFLFTEWFVVDSGSTDGTAEAIERRWPDIALHRRPNIGFAAAANVALARAQGRYVLVLNPDVEIASGKLAHLIAALDERPEVGAASVIQRSPDGDVLPSIRRFPTVGRELGEALGIARLRPFRSMQETEVPSARYDDEAAADWLVGAFLVVRREALEAAGELDERFFLYSEETDWCHRIREAGWEIVHLPVMTVVHHVGDYDAPELRAQLTHSKLLYADKHFGFPRRLAFRAAVVTKHALRTTVFRARRDPQRAAAERRALSIASRGAKPSTNGKPAAPNGEQPSGTETDRAE